MLMYLTIKSAFSIEFDNQILNKRFTEKKKKKIFQYVNKDLITTRIWNSVLMDRRSVMLLFTCTSEDMLEGKGGARERQGARASEVVVVLVFVKHGDEGGGIGHRSRNHISLPLFSHVYRKASS